MKTILKILIFPAIFYILIAILLTSSQNFREPELKGESILGVTHTRGQVELNQTIFFGIKNNRIP